ncbi:MAG: DUF1127 domain-containing protein [Thiothrix sp.]|nr:DUF1127 domain-containing protein [Thiothrix sp.]HPE61274.1 DUF1127 domain-containing protein [Thiolinea sp.]
MSILSTVAKVIGNALQTQQKARVLQLFRNMSDRELADIGVSRELLNQGVQAYPWRVDEPVEAVNTPVTTSYSKEAQSGTGHHLAV